jgi:hypothetical protein
VYRKNDPELSTVLNTAKKYYTNVSTKGFLFWQTGLAYGFVPIGIDEYEGRRGIVNKLRLFFTIGPTVIIEALIIGLIKYFFILMIGQFIWFLVRKRHFLLD